MEERKKVILSAFWILIIFSLFYIIRSFINFPYDFNIINLNAPLKHVAVSFELGQKINSSDLLICIEDRCSSPYSDFFGNVYSNKLGDWTIASATNDSNQEYNNSRIKNIKIAYLSKLKNIDINNIYISNGNENYYYSKEDISKFQKKDIYIKFDNEEGKQLYTAIIPPEIDNYKGIINHLVILFLSLFSNWMIIPIPYLWLFIAYLLYLFNKDCFNFKFNLKIPKNIHLYTLILITLIGIFLRVQDITYIPLWIDEVYTQTIATESIKSVFQDPGNPPLFFFLEFLFAKIFSSNVLTLRILPMLFSVGIIPVTYILFKNISKNLALFASFLACINTVFIYHAQEARGYSMCMLLTVCSIYLLFKYLKNPNKKNLIYYGLICIALINSSYYLILITISNAIWGIADLFENKNKNKIIPFILTNAVCALTLTPYIIISGKNALSENFNAWIEPISNKLYNVIISNFFVNKYMFIIICLVVLFNLVLCFIPKIKINKEKENLYIYLIYTIVSFFIMACLISVFIKPILHDRALMSLYGLLFITEVLLMSSLIEFEKFNKWLYSVKALYFVIILGIYFFITVPINYKDAVEINHLMYIIEKEAPIYHAQGYEVHGILPDYKEYVKGYPKVKDMDYIIWHKLMTNAGHSKEAIKKEDYTKTKDKVIVYSSTIGINVALLEFNPKAHVYYSSNEYSPIIKMVY